MDNIAREVLKTKLVSFKGTGFQDAIDRVFLTIYAEDDFVRIKQKRDQGSDGILNSNTVVAAYAPEKYSLNDFKKKVKSDHTSYLNNWADTHENWMVVTNLEMTSAMLKFITSLKGDTKSMCIEQLLEFISKQTWTKKSAIFNALDIPDKYLTNDVLDTAVNDLIKLCDGGTTFQPYEQPIYIRTKIDMNVSEDCRDLFLDDYEEALSIFPMLQNVIQSRNSTVISAIRSKIRVTYSGLSGPFDNKFNSMVSALSGIKEVDEYYKYHMRIILIYFFEQCLFGQKTDEEKAI